MESRSRTCEEVILIDELPLTKQFLLEESDGFFQRIYFSLDNRKNFIGVYLKIMVSHDVARSHNLLPLYRGIGAKQFLFRELI